MTDQKEPKQSACRFSSECDADGLHQCETCYVKFQCKKIQDTRELSWICQCESELGAKHDAKTNAMVPQILFYCGRECAQENNCYCLFDASDFEP